MPVNICVSIAEENYGNMVSALANYDFAEIRLDLCKMNESEIRKVFAIPNKQLIATCREGFYNENDRISRLSVAIEAGAAYVDIEVEENDNYRQTLLEKAKAKGCKVIISHHDFEHTPDVDKLQAIIATCEQMGADVVKLVTTARSNKDAATILSLYTTERRNLVAFAMGATGRITRLACLFLGAPFTYASASDLKAVASGQLNIAAMQQLTNLLLVDVMKKFAITGNPVTHSKSPKLFATAYDCSYGMKYILLPALSAAESMELFKAENITGMNVTAPFKTDILEFVDEQSDEVKVIGATNTIVKLENGKLKAYNTDYLGVLGAFGEVDISLSGKRCLLLGIGGAGKAAAYAITKAGGVLTIANRTVEKAEEFAKKVGASAIALDKVNDIIGNYDIIVNTLYPNIDCVDSTNLHTGQVLLDASYIGSILLDKAIKQGCKCIDGRYWILHQAIIGFELLTGIKPDVQAMRDKLLNS